MSIVKRTGITGRPVRPWERGIGNRPPEGYVCKIPCTLRTPVLCKAVTRVLNRISEEFFSDAFVLEQRVRMIVPLDEDDAWSSAGAWLPPYIVVRDKRMSFAIACAVIAHELGHAAAEGEGMSHRIQSQLPTEFFKEAMASHYAIKWGFESELRRAQERLAVITFEELRAVHKAVEDAPSYGGNPLAEMLLMDPRALTFVARFLS